MDRRLFVTGLFGVTGVAALAALVPNRVLADELVPDSNILPDLEKAGPENGSEGEMGEGEQLAWHYGYRHRRRYRRRRWRRVCRRYWYSGYWRRRCRRRPYWIWIALG